MIWDESDLRYDMNEPVLYDALSEKRCALRVPYILTIYVCGVTVYDHCHVGHGRTKVVFDILRRWLSHLGQQVKFVTNITDIDDKIIAKANAQGESCLSLANRYIDSMHEDDRSLGVLPPDLEPRATDYVREMIDLISVLMDKNKAYISDGGDVCLDVSCHKDYGQISKQDISQLREHAQLSESLKDKRDVVDFVLWKKAKPSEPFWPSPWGEGRPGWHLECSAMAKHTLGHPIHWHGGGVDLKFPHHENECAQSEAAFGAPYSKQWMHVGLINRSGVKMSKSLGNTVILKDALLQYGANVLRMFYLKTHYRKPLSWTDEALEEAVSRWERYARVCRMASNEEGDDVLWDAWHRAMADDMNTSLAMVHMDAWAKMALSNKDDADKYASLLRKALTVWGCQLQDQVLDDDWIVTLVKRREVARSSGDYALSDEIRSELSSHGIVVEDTEEGMIWFRK